MARIPTEFRDCVDMGTLIATDITYPAEVRSPIRSGVEIFDVKLSPGWDETWILLHLPRYFRTKGKLEIGVRAIRKEFSHSPRFQNCDRETFVANADFWQPGNGTMEGAMTTEPEMEECHA